MNRYYADSKIFNWLRTKLGVTKPYALELGKWDEWRDEFRKNKPVVFWLTETLPDLLEKPAEKIVDPLYDAKCYIRNRWITKSHALTSNLKKGEYYEFDTRMLHCLFDELVNFVEIEKAHLQVVFCGDKEKHKKYNMPWWNSKSWLRWGQWRSAEAGIDYLKWEISITLNQDYGVYPSDPEWGKPTGQAKAAKEILDLYTWWKVDRPARPSADDLSGWTEHYNKEMIDSSTGKFNWNRKRSKKERQILARHRRIERRYDREDQEMMIRLIKISSSLWT